MDGDGDVGGAGGVGGGGWLEEEADAAAAALMDATMTGWSIAAFWGGKNVK